MQTQTGIQTLRQAYSHLLNPTQAHGRTTDKFKLVNTNKIIDQLEDHGFELSGITAANTIRKDFAGFQRHAIFFKAPWTQNEREVQQLMLVNDHRGMCTLRFYAGFFVHACLNQLDYAEKQCPAIKLRHGQNVYSELNQILPTMRDFMSFGADFTNKLKNVQVDKLVQGQFAKLACKYATKQLEKNYLFSADTLHTYRHEDMDNTGFNVLNRVQENIIKGRFRYLAPRKDRRTNHMLNKSVKAVAIKSIERKLDLNRYLMAQAQDLFLN